MPLTIQAPLCTEAIAWASNCTTWPDPKTLYAVNQFIKNCKNHGNWGLMDRFWLLGTGIQDNSLVSLINPTSAKLIQNGTPTWIQYVGWKGDGSAAYFDTGYLPGVSNVQANGTNLSAGVWASIINTNSGGVDMGTCCGALTICSWFEAGYNRLIEMNDSNITGSLNTDIGLFCGVRTVPTTTNVWVNGVDVFNTGSVGGGGWASGSNIDIFRYGGIGYPSNAQLFLAYIGSGNMDQVAFYNDCQMLYNRLNG